MFLFPRFFFTLTLVFIAGIGVYHYLHHQMWVYDIVSDSFSGENNPSSSFSRGLFVWMTTVGLTLLLLAASVYRLIKRNVQLPLDQIQRSLERYAEDLESSQQRYLDVFPSSFLPLEKTLRRLLATLKTDEVNLRTDHYAMEAILKNMKEGVIALDSSENILLMNSAAKDMFYFNEEEVKGKALVEVIREPALKKIVNETKQQGLTLETEISSVRHHTIYHAYSVPWKDVVHDHVLGVVLVIADVTKIRSLEKVRREFVSNVSHELKTPITSIKGYIETFY